VARLSGQAARRVLGATNATNAADAPDAAGPACQAQWRALAVRTTDMMTQDFQAPTGVV
jgi:hypothetical protein